MLGRANSERQWQDFLTARIESLHANINRDVKKRKKPFSLADFMVTGKPQKRARDEQTPEQMLRQVEHINRLLGGANEQKRDQ